MITYFLRCFSCAQPLDPPLDPFLDPSLVPPLDPSCHVPTPTPPKPSFVLLAGVACHPFMFDESKPILRAYSRNTQHILNLPVDGYIQSISRAENSYLVWVLYCLRVTIFGRNIHPSGRRGRFLYLCVPPHVPTSSREVQHSIDLRLYTSPCAKTHYVCLSVQGVGWSDWWIVADMQRVADDRV